MITSTGEIDAGWEKRRRMVYRRDKGMCRYCLKELSLHGENVAHIDHVIPRSLMGTDDMKNLVTSCARCNIQKGQRTPEQAGMFLYEVPIVFTPENRDALINEDYLEWVKVKYGPDENGSRIRRRATKER